MVRAGAGWSWRKTKGSDESSLSCRSETSIPSAKLTFENWEKRGKCFGAFCTASSALAQAASSFRIIFAIYRPRLISAMSPFRLSFMASKEESGRSCCLRSCPKSTGAVASTQRTTGIHGFLLRLRSDEERQKPQCCHDV